MSPCSIAFVKRVVVLSLSLLAAQAVVAQSAQEQLFSKVLEGARCKKTAGTGLVCTYKIGDELSISVTDVGGSDTEVSFLRSNSDSEFFAAFYSECIVVLPGNARARTNDPVTNVYISPKSGRIYRNVQQCHGGR
jgi:hypothetical protein